MDVGNGTRYFFFQEKHKNLSPHFIIMEIQKMTQAQVKKAIKECEGKHIQQVAYSSYHDALTQICFGCGIVRTSLKDIL